MHIKLHEQNDKKTIILQKDIDLIIAEVLHRTVINPLFRGNDVELTYIYCLVFIQVNYINISYLIFLRCLFAIMKFMVDSQDNQNNFNFQCVVLIQ